MQKRDYAAEFAAEQNYKRERQKALNERHCEPGYTYNEVLGKCLLPEGVRIVPEEPEALQEAKKRQSNPASPENALNAPQSHNTTVSADAKISQEYAKRMSAKMNGAQV